MSAVVEKKALAAATAFLASVVPSRNTIPILANMRIEARDNVLMLQATDLDRQVSLSIPAKVETSFATTVPGRKLAAIVSLLDDGAEIRLKSDAGAVHIRSCRSNHKLPSLPIEDFPSIPTDKDWTTQFTVDAAALHKLFARSRIAHCTDEQRYYINGAYLVCYDGNLAAVATDGHRLVRQKMVAPDGAGTLAGVILPTLLVDLLLRELESGQVDVAVNDRLIRFEIGDVVLLSKLIDGTFPQYERVIPANNDKMLKLDAALLRKAVQRVSVVRDDKQRNVRFDLDQDRLTLTVDLQDGSVGNEEVPVDWQSEPLTIGFNSDYLKGFATIAAEDLHCSIVDPKAPMLIEMPDDPDFTGVLMPMRA